MTTTVPYNLVFSFVCLEHPWNRTIIHYTKLSLPTGWCWCCRGDKYRFNGTTIRETIGVKDARKNEEAWHLNLWIPRSTPLTMLCVTSSSLVVLRQRGAATLLFSTNTTPTHTSKPKRNGVEWIRYIDPRVVMIGSVRKDRRIYVRTHYGNRPWALSLFVIRIGAIIPSSIYCELKDWDCSILWTSIHTYRMGEIKRDPIGSIIP